MLGFQVEDGRLVVPIAQERVVLCCSSDVTCRLLLQSALSVTRYSKRAVPTLRVGRPPKPPRGIAHEQTMPEVSSRFHTDNTAKQSDASIITDERSCATDYVGSCNLDAEGLHKSIFCLSL